MSIALNREDGGRLVREAWLRWARIQPDPKPSWLLSWEELAEADKEADRIIWDEIVAPYTQAISSLIEERIRQQKTIDNLMQRVEELRETLAHSNFPPG